MFLHNICSEILTDLVVERLPSDLSNSHLAGAESSEVLAGLGTGVSKELHHHPAHGNIPDADVEETSWLFNAHGFFSLKNENDILQVAKDQD